MRDDAVLGRALPLDRGLGPTRNFTSGKSDVYVLVAAARRGFEMVLRPTAAATRGFTITMFHSLRQ